MTGNLNMDNHEIVKLNDEPTTGTDAVILLHGIG